ncbi:Pyruvate/2-oxoglutarate dehydrogenase complex, dihydrolipoamide dehydrogenase (E3) component [Sanguibacter gelidistatuariae]|uniref:Pyruvate/2-oxoglutarate dehydrogenase complex, dihydrolipoamide dehydrogenase (E3) component n=2 Tax=Sanguibacter gelidistatuariae TaxID=1814289 RepID=A0A1G6L448_9MICO|nr:Pyruvate/2-oxoglutarate dehydrogenase complex, dihydrolipoamide dehydrogenase (E3) component [Sanguibacter gelidistatuariae]
MRRHRACGTIPVAALPGPWSDGLMSQQPPPTALSDPAIEDIELLVVGGGKAGKTLAMEWANAGRRVAMIERGWIGGTCINVACIPTKTLVTSARALRMARRARELGFVVGQLPGDPLAGDVAVDIDLLRAHKEGVVGEMVASQRSLFLASGMDLVIGEAVFVAPRTVRVTADDGSRRTLRGEQVVINTGARPLVPDLDGLTDVPYLTSETLLELRTIPRSLVVLGGGVVSTELAQMFAVFGSSVTVIERGPHLLSRLDPAVSDAVADALRADGVDVRLSAPAHSVARAHWPGGEGVVVHLADGSQITADALLVATGRTPATATLDLPSAGVDVTDRGFVATDEFLRTTAPGTWAAGDVAGTPQFTHASYDDYRVLRANLAGGSVSTAGRVIPSAVFIDPELAMIGLSQVQAEAAGYTVKVARMPVAKIPRAHTLRATAGLWSAVVDADTNLLLGVTLMGAEASESLTSAQMVMSAGLPYTALRDAIIIHPTMTEGFTLLFAGID